MHQLYICAVNVSEAVDVATKAAESASEAEQYARCEAEARRLTHCGSSSGLGCRRGGAVTDAADGGTGGISRRPLI